MRLREDDAHNAHLLHKLPCGKQKISLVTPRAEVTYDPQNRARTQATDSHTASLSGLTSWLDQEPRLNRLENNNFAVYSKDTQSSFFYFHIAPSTSRSRSKTRTLLQFLKADPTQAAPGFVLSSEHGAILIRIPFGFPADPQISQGHIPISITCPSSPGCRST